MNDDTEYYGLEPWERPATSPTAGMNIAQRILHVGGRNNEAGYVEFGSIQAVEALVRQVLRDLPDTQPKAPEQSEPVAIFRADEDGGFVELIAYQGQPMEDGAKLYTAAPQPTELNYEELLGAIARGWCTPINERKVMDSDLAIAIAEEVVKYLAAQRSK